jgi:NAD(P)-dependent dehydrogenase (short-subunit alcohol dehydrogenase family)
MKIKGKVVVISGGASGMGAMTAQHLSNLGARVAILDNHKDLHDVAKNISALPINCDVTNEENVVDAFATIKKKLDVPRICVNCAGIVSGKRIVSTDQAPMALNDFTHVIQVNLIGTFNVLRVAAAHIAKLDMDEESEEENGVIINTASIAAYEGQIGQAAYAASKGGVVSLTLPAARELSRYKIRVMTIAPGLIETPMLHSLSETVRDALIATVPFPKRFGKPQEFSILVQHIIENPLLNGSVIRLDGGLRMSAK